MNTTLLIAFFLLMLMVSVRYYEIKKQKLTKISIYIRKGDIFVLKGYELFLILIEKLLVKLQEIKNSTFANSWKGLVSIINFIKHKIDIIHKKINGKTNIKEKGHASFYLQSVKEHKIEIHNKNNN